jgi:alpha-L-rhamnosidase
VDVKAQKHSSDQSIKTIRRAKGMGSIPTQLTNPITIPAHSKVSLLLDQEYNTVAYPELTVSGGKSSSIQLTYAEALFTKQFEKGNRNEIEGKEIIGNHDIFIADVQDLSVFTAGY